MRATAKRTPAVKSWLRVLEEPVRKFVVDKGMGEAEEDEDEVVLVMVMEGPVKLSPSKSTTS